MIVALNSNWKIPIGYFLLNGLSGSEKANLINTALTMVYDTDVLVKTLTFDGVASNISMATTLGAKLYSPNTKTFFFAPNNQGKHLHFIGSIPHTQVL